MKIRAVPVGCMPRGRYGSRIGLIRRTEINLGYFDSLFLFNRFLAVDWIIYSAFVNCTQFEQLTNVGSEQEDLIRY
jgi:hypothetical protein